VVVGAGFIGCEVTASLRKLGVDVVLVEPQPAPLASVLGERIGELVARLHRAEGVDVRTGVGVAEVREYRAMFWDKGQPSGEWCDVAKITVSP
jgi:NADPH-dependent 2,4-dienoyl-CoA reductase/sulfur reductase-like enzyme